MTEQQMDYFEQVYKTLNNNEDFYLLPSDKLSCGTNVFTIDISEMTGKKSLVMNTHLGNYVRRFQ